MIARCGRRGGFTILEVLVAVFVVGTVLSALVALVGTNLSQLARTRSGIERARLAEERLREIEHALASGTTIRDGTEEGHFDPPNEDIVWRTSVSAFAIPLPTVEGDTAGSPPLASPLFTSGAATPTSTGSPPIRHIEVRVHSAAEDPERAAAMELLWVEPYVPPESEPSTEDAPPTEPSSPGEPAAGTPEAPAFP